MDARPIGDYEKLLTEAVWRRAWRDTDKFRHSIWFWLVDLFVGLGVAGYCYYNDLPGNVSPLVGAGAAILLLALVALAAVIAAPGRQRDDARNAVRELQIARNTQRDELAGYYKAGKSLYHERPQSFEEWEPRLNDWILNTSNFLRVRFSNADADMFEDPPSFMAASISGSLPGKHNIKRLVLDSRLGVLRRILERPEDHAGTR